MVKYTTNSIYLIDFIKKFIIHLCRVHFLITRTNKILKIAVAHCADSTYIVLIMHNTFKNSIMKSRSLILLGLVIIAFMFACKKGSSIYPGQINGKWNVVSDSTYNEFLLSLTQRNYIGKAGDYYDFRTDGKVYINESNTLDTLTYNLVNDTTIQIQNFGWILNGVQNTSYMKYSSNNANVSITTGRAITPGGFGWRQVNLKR